MFIFHMKIEKSKLNFSMRDMSFLGDFKKTEKEGYKPHLGYLLKIVGFELY